MTSLTDRTIAALRATRDELAEVTERLTGEQLTSRSGASEWSVAQALSHLGSGSEIALATLQAAVGAAPSPEAGFNQQVWDRWNALSPHDQAAGFLAADEELVKAFEALTVEQRTALHVAVGFLPAPLPLGGFAGMRLNEAALHSWDVRVSLDRSAAIAAETAELIAGLFATDLAFLLGFTGNADALAHPAVVDIDGSGHVLTIADSVSIGPSAAAPTATFTGPLEAAVRLLAGRLTADYTPAEVDVVGNLTLDDLRRVFPGY